ncbi:MAG: DNA polymerase III subunit gamma/tau [Patescibacteria group bacterium]|nr:DNA polymerase III subunit gamma/tau [Patescibacteria group bacterium]
MAVLYQKYRPQQFSEIFGQNHIKTTLQNEISSDKISHAYLFCGPRAVGKTTLARILAKTVNCQNRKKSEFEPCNKCDNCLSISNFSNLDVIEIDAASNTGVDNVRENIIALSRVKSSNNKYKVFIIDEIHMLSLSAFNALLKTLEEPPANVIFILCTTEIYKVPLTIISRCERFDFKRISVNDMIAKLEVIIKNEKIEIERDVLELIALKADGHLRDAESLLSQIIAVSGKKIDMASANLVIPYNNLEENIKLLEALGRKDTATAIKIINELLNSGINLKNFLNDLVELLRKMILSKVNDSLSSSLGLDLSEKLEIKISELNKNFSLNDLTKITEEFLLASKELSLASIPSLPIELALINICQTESSNPIIKNSSFNSSKTINSNLKEDSVLNQNSNLKSVSNFNFSSNSKKNSSESNLSLEDVKKNWTEFVTKLKPHNHSLAFIMQSCQINDVDENKICLSFKYKFHKDRLDSPEIKKIIEDVLVDVYKTRIDLKVIVDENLEINNNKNDNNEIIDNLLKTFGGKIIN